MLKGHDEQETHLFTVNCDLPCLSADVIIQVSAAMMSLYFHRITAALF